MRCLLKSTVKYSLLGMVCICAYRISCVCRKTRRMQLNTMTLASERVNKVANIVLTKHKVLVLRLCCETLHNGLNTGNSGLR
jgi:hypothetical protein